MLCITFATLLLPFELELDVFWAMPIAQQFFGHWTEYPGDYFTAIKGALDSCPEMVITTGWSPAATLGRTKFA